MRRLVCDANCKLNNGFLPQSRLWTPLEAEP